MVSVDLTVPLEPLGEVVGCEADRARCWASSHDQTASKSNIPGPRRAISSGVAVAFEVEWGRHECPGARVTGDVLQAQALEEFLIQALDFGISVGSSHFRRVAGDERRPDSRGGAVPLNEAHG